MSLIRTTRTTNTFRSTSFALINSKILFGNPLFRHKSTTINEAKHGPPILENQKDNIDNENKSPASINIVLKNSFVKENDIPWTGEEDIKTTVLRMIVDKYPPLKIKRDSIKEYIDAHNKVNLPNLSPSPLREWP